MSKMENLAPADVARWLAERAILLIDVREPEEYSVERIHGALLFPLSSFDPNPFPTPASARSCSSAVLACARPRQWRHVLMPVWPSLVTWPVDCRPEESGPAGNRD